ncbi:MAG: hypothetical protein IBX55_14040 [Methyloprofundus sp.]|nr:hypothetical protein [Methyloprofundus sp.]
MISSKQQETMTSLDLRDLINAARVEHGESKVENGHLLKRIEDELEGELGVSKIFRHPQSGAEMRYYDLTRDQCTLVGMRESKGVRRSVLEKLKAVESVVVAAPIERSKAREVIEDGMAIAALFEVPTHYAQIETVKEARRLTGVDYSPLLLQSPAQDDVSDDDVMLEPSKLAPMLGLASGTEANRLLSAIGLQKRVKGQWEPTSKGKSLCQRHSWVKGDKSGYNFKWNLKTVKELIS